MVTMPKVFPSKAKQKVKSMSNVNIKNNSKYQIRKYFKAILNKLSIPNMIDY